MDPGRTDIKTKRYYDKRESGRANPDSGYRGTDLAQMENKFRTSRTVFKVYKIKERRIFV